ncbi:LysR family transcriptional regulator [Robbsia sp. KACC 23696]|uniref:LysR family transcriptional regulator n=1 Tax=Robbsia sp. KACC 23696 TaxID=3149231 RepID=UPI00325B5B5B
MEGTKIEALWGHVHWLTVLASQGSYTRAAERLGVSKAAMSVRITELEQAVGVPLVQRTTRSVRLTEAGQALVAQTQTAFQQIADGVASVRDLGAAPRGRVRVTAPVAFARQQLVPRLPAFLKAHADVRVEVDMSDRLTAIANDGFDLAIRHSSTVPDTHVAWLLAPTRSLLVASPTYLRRQGIPRTLDALRHHSCLHYPRGTDAPVWTFEPRAPQRLGVGTRAKSATRVRADDLTGPSDSVVHGTRVVVPVFGCFAANNSEALRDAALAHMGIALLPDFSAQSALRARKLVAVLPEWQPTGVFAETIYLIRPHTAHVPRAVRALVAYLRESFREGFEADAV